MLFGLIGSDLVASNRALLDDSEWKAWCEQWRALHELYQQQHLEHTQLLARKTHPETSKEWDEGEGAGYRFFPLVRMVATRRGVAFRRPPETYLHYGDFKPLPDSDPQVQQWRRDEADIRLAETLKAVEHQTLVMGQTVVQPSWHRGRMRWTKHPPYDVRVLQDETAAMDIDRALAVQLRLRRRKRLVVAEPDRWLSWERTPVVGGPDTWQVVIRDDLQVASKAGLFDDEVNAYGRHPIVLWQFEEPDVGDLWVPPDEVLLRLQLAINVDLTDLTDGLKYVRHPLAIENTINRPRDDAPSVRGASRLRSYIDEKSTLRFETPSLNVETDRATIEWQLQMYAVSLGFPPDTFAVNSSTRNLGAKQHESLELQIQRESIQGTIKRLITDTFDVHRVVANYWAARGPANGRTLYDPRVQLGVNLAEVPMITDRAQEEQARASEAARFLDSVVEQEMRDNSISRAEATARIAQRRRDAAATPPGGSP